MKLIVPIIYNQINRPVPRATVRLNIGPNSWITDMTDEDGTCNLTVDESLDDTQFEVYTCDYIPYGIHINLGTGNKQIRVGLAADPNRPQDIILPSLISNNTFPNIPTRDEMLSINMAFQGTYVNTSQYGFLPWFEPALAWLNADDRQNVYIEKKLNNETHCAVLLPSGPPLYDEPNQPYSADRFGPLDYTNGNTAIDNVFIDLVAEVILEGFKVLLFLGGDNGQKGYEIATKQLPLVIDALAHNDYETDLNAYCIIIPGFDGVFYGYTPEQIEAFGLQFRSLNANGYLGIEHSTGHIPTGNGPSDYNITGPMSTYDVILGEFNTEQKDDTVWQVLGRMLGPLYKRPSDQPTNDDPNPPFYLAQQTLRGKYYYIVFEYDTYHWVRGMSTERHMKWKNYLISCGAEFIC